MKVAVVGGGAAGFFLAVNLKEMMPHLHVTILEKGSCVLRKVAVSGGGRFNCTNTFDGVSDLRWVYPRGHRLMKRLFNVFGPADARHWFERHGVSLTVQPDHCVFPASQDSQTIIDCFTSEARRLGVEVRTNCRIDSLQQLSDYDFIAFTPGGLSPSVASLLEGEGIDVVAPCPSLFTFNIADQRLRALQGLVIDNVSVMLPGTKHRASGPLLITHWGVSGPAVLRLSSYAAGFLKEKGYRSPLLVNWVGDSHDGIMSTLHAIASQNPDRQVVNLRPYDLPSRLWQHLAEKSLGQRAHTPWGNLNAREMQRLCSVLESDSYQIDGRAAFKDEFVTAGGVALPQVNPNTLESRQRPRLYFAGEVLDVDGITGGFNFQCAWTTAYVAASAIAQAAASGE